MKNSIKISIGIAFVATFGFLWYMLAYHRDLMQKVWQEVSTNGFLALLITTLAFSIVGWVISAIMALRGDLR